LSKIPAMVAVAQAAICLFSVAMVDGSTFLASHNASLWSPTREDVEDKIWRAVEMVDESEKLESDDVLQSLFATMPKNEQGNLEVSAVRYVLHRYFEQKHGWQVFGLRSTGNDSMAFKNDGLEAIFKHMERAHKGFDLQAVEVVASAVSDLIRQEAESELAYILDALNFGYEDLDFIRVKSIFKSFMVAKIWGVEEEGTPLAGLLLGEAQLQDEYLGWSDTKMWANDQIETYAYQHLTERNPFVSGMSFKHAGKITVELNHRHSAFHFLECQSLKEKLLELEHKGTGRVTLSSFYSGGRHESWPFVEKVAYLRSTGALDETDPQNPKVIIPNYLTSATNCIGTSSYYSLCCRDECEDILAQVEKFVSEPSGTPSRIVEIISVVGSASVDAPRNISLVHTNRLEEIAAHHAGKVPLHGRLFAQWLHHLFPQECAFPHISGTTSNLSPEDWAAEMGLEDANEDESEMRRLSFFAGHSTDDTLPWTAVEELVSVHKFSRGAMRTESMMGFVRKVVDGSIGVSSVFNICIDSNT